MGEVIYFDFRAPKMSEREQYLHWMAVELDEFDFEEIVEAINDPKLYESLEDELKPFVDEFWQKAG
jgi:hypothetical protein